MPIVSGLFFVVRGKRSFFYFLNLVLSLSLRAFKAFQHHLLVVEKVEIAGSIAAVEHGPLRGILIIAGLP